MTYRWEPTTPLDRILATGFKRIDEAVEGVIDKYPPDFSIPEVSKLKLEGGRLAGLVSKRGLQTHQETAFGSEMARRQGEGLQNAYWHQEQLLNRAGQNMMLGESGHCSAGMAAQQGATDDWWQKRNEFWSEDKL